MQILSQLTRHATPPGGALVVSRAANPEPTVPLRRTLWSSAPARAKHWGIQGASGNQGKAYTWAALEGAHREGRLVHAIVRDKPKYLQGSDITDGRVTVALAGHPRLRVTTDPKDVPLEDTVFLNATSAAGVGPTLDALPPGARVLMTQNGVVLQRGHHDGLLVTYGISVMATSPGTGTEVKVVPGGKLQVGADNPFLADILAAFDKQGVFDLEVVDDIHAAKWEKIAINSALNAPATLFGKRLGDFLEAMKDDPRYERLIGGLAREVCAVAVALAVSVRPADQVIGSIHAVMRNNPQHPTSMQSSFLKGQELELPVLNQGVSAIARDVKVATPLNDLIVRKMALYEGLRREFGASADFHVRHRDEVAAVTQEVLQAAVSLA